MSLGKTARGPLRWTVLSLLVVAGCGNGEQDNVNSEEAVAEAEGGSSEEDAPAVSDEGLDDEANPDRVPIAGEGKERGRIHGTLEVPGYTKGTIQLDAVVELEDGQKVIANERYQRPGPFRLVVRGDYEEVNLIAYVDLDDDGPTAGDVRYEYEGNPIAVADGERIEGLIVRVVEEQAVIVDEESPGTGGEEPVPAPPAEEGEKSAVGE